MKPLDRILFIIAFLVSFLCLIKSCSASFDDDEISNLLTIIAQAESSNGKFLRGDGGKSLGKYQISQAVLEDFNKATGKNYQFKQLLDNKISEEVARWHAKRIIRLLKRKKMYSVAKFCQVWNEGFIALQRKIPRTHKNLIYRGIYGAK